MTTFEEAVRVRGAFSCETFNPPDACISNTHVALNAAIAASKLQHQRPSHYAQASGTAVVTESKLLHVASGAGSIVAINVTPDTPPTNGGSDDKQFTVDVQMSTGGGAFATVLTAVVTITKTAVARTPVAASLIVTPTFAAGAVFKVIVTASGSVGTQAQGVLVQMLTNEAGS